MRFGFRGVLIAAGVSLLIPAVTVFAGPPGAESAPSQAWLRSVPARFPKLKPGMTRQQVWGTLGVPSGQTLPTRGSGTPTHFIEGLRVGNAGMELIFDHDRLKSSRLTNYPPIMPKKGTSGASAGSPSRR